MRTLEDAAWGFCLRWRLGPLQFESLKKLLGKVRNDSNSPGRCYVQQDEPAETTPAPADPLEKLVQDAHFVHYKLHPQSSQSYEADLHKCIAKLAFEAGRQNVLAEIRRAKGAYRVSFGSTEYQTVEKFVLDELEKAG